MPDMPMSSFIIVIGLLLVAALVYIALASMPGDIARERKHPYADAINFLGWVGLLFGGIPWLIAMVWARMQPRQLLAATKLETPAEPEDSGD